MTLRFLYVDPGGGFNVDLGNTAVRLGSISGLNLAADSGAVTGSSISIDNPSGTVGHSNDGLTGRKFFFVDELACSSGNQRIYAGLIGAREYTHADSETDSLRLSSANHINAELESITKLLTLRVLLDFNRPAEPVGNRVSALMALSEWTEHMSTDTTYVVLPSTPQMDANNYAPSSTLLDVLSDCALDVGYNVGLIWNDETTDKPLLWFDDINTSTAYASTIRLSNVLSEIDSFPTTGTVGATKTYSLAGTKLRRDPARIASSVVYPYRKGYQTATNAATAKAFIASDVVAPSQTVKTSARALARAQVLSSQLSTEEDVLTGTVQLAAANVNDLRELQSVSVHDTHAQGYSGFKTWRVIQRVPKQDEETPELYNVDLTMTPIVTASTVGCNDPLNVDLNFLHGTVTGYMNVPTTYSNHPTEPVDPANMNDGDDTTGSGSSESLIDGRIDGTYWLGWQSDLGSAYIVACHTYRWPPNGITQVVPSRIDYSTDGSTWTTIGWTGDYSIAGWVTYVQSASILARYWRLLAEVDTPHNLPFGFSFWAGLAGRTWKINGQ